MAKQEYIAGAERDAYMKEFMSIVLTTVDGVIKLADRHNIDRDNAIEHFATIFKTMQEVSTFQSFGKEAEGD